MDDVLAALREAFEDGGYDVDEVSRNRDRIRVAVRDGEASAQALREVTHGVLEESDVLGLNVTTESLDGDEVSTVVSFRYRD